MKIKDLAKLTFVDADPQEMEIHILTTVEGLLQRKLARADPLRLFLLSVEGAVAHKSCATAFFMHKKSLHPSKRAEAGVK